MGLSGKVKKERQTRKAGHRKGQERPRPTNQVESKIQKRQIKKRQGRRSGAERQSNKRAPDKESGTQKWTRKAKGPPAKQQTNQERTRS